MNPNNFIHKTKIEKLHREEGRKGESASWDGDANFKSLNTYGYDLVEMARKLNPVIICDLQIDYVINILSRQLRNNPVLVGQLQLWSIHLAEGLARRIRHGNVPNNLLDVHLMALDMGSLTSGAKYCGECVDRVQAVLKEVEEAKGSKIILFINELDKVLGRAEGSMDAANLFKAMVARGELQCIGAMALEEYQKYVKKDVALDSRFQPVYLINEAMRSVISISQEVLNHKAIDLDDRAHANVRVQLDSSQSEGIDNLESSQIEFELHALEKTFKPTKAWFVELKKESDDLRDKVRRLMMKYKKENKRIDKIRKLKQLREKLMIATQEAERRGNLPRITEINFGTLQEIDATIAMLEGDANENLMLTETVEPEHIAEVVRHWTDRIPAVTRLQGQNEKEINRLIGLAERLHERVVGQNEAVNTVAEAVLRSRVGLGWPQQPIGSFLFLGPAGVGKTELAKALAEQLFDDDDDDDDDDLLIHIDMSEYMDQHSVAHLIGGMLTEAVRRRPYCVILFDQVEKAHVALFNTLLQVLDGGRLTDGQGRTVDFTNTVIIITSNLAAEYLLDGMVLQGQYASLQIARERVLIEVRKHFRPELLNRLDEIVIFDPLSHDQLRKVARLQMMDIALRLADRDIVLAITDDALDVVISEPCDLVYNASSIKKSLAKKVVSHLSKMLVQGEIDESSIVYVDAVRGKKELSFKVEKNGDFVHAETESKSNIQ